MADTYTIVVHSGYGYGGDPTFARGLETRAVPRRMVDAVREAGGVLTSSAFAGAIGDAEMYPPGTMGLVPAASGCFAAVAIDSLNLYIPTVVGQLADSPAHGSPRPRGSRTRLRSAPGHRKPITGIRRPRR